MTPVDNLLDDIFHGLVSHGETQALLKSRMEAHITQRILTVLEGLKEMREPYLKDGVEIEATPLSVLDSAIEEVRRGK